MNQLCTELPCVSVTPTWPLLPTLINTVSASSTVQIFIFRQGKMASRLDYDCGEYAEGRVDQELQSVHNI
jgi:hypothetical protein